MQLTPQGSGSRLVPRRKRELAQEVRAAVMQRKEAADVAAKAAAKGEPVNPSDENAPLPIFLGY